jgi:hypothetical protein
MERLNVRGQRRGTFAGGAELDRDDLILVDEAGGQESAGFGIGFEIARESEAGGGGEFFEDLGLGAREGGGESLEAFFAGGFGDGLTLFVGEAVGEGRGKEFLIGRGHGRRDAGRAIT